MFMHNKRLMYTVRVSEPNPMLASLFLEQFGGPDGDFTGFKDAREVWWCATTVSPINGLPGTYLSTHDGKRYQAPKHGCERPGAVSFL